MRTTSGRQRVDVIYRRIDDAYLDPLAFRKDSMLGVPGLFAAYRAGNVALANAVGTGVADDKSTYPYVPEMIRFYLEGRADPRQRADLAVPQPEGPRARAGEPGRAGGEGSAGLGRLRHAGRARRVEAAGTRRRSASALKANPANYIAQPTLSLSTCPTFVKRGVAPRHVDLRPYVLSGKDVKLVPGGLTRVALKEGSLVVNSSQGGGTKDTWVVE